MKDFFISYNKADSAWAAWIAWVLEEAGYSVVIAEWDFRPGENFALRMHSAAKDAKQTIAIVSDNYLSAEYTHAEWAAAFAQDPQGNARTLIPIKISECQKEGLLGPIIYTDLTELTEEQARARVLESFKDRAKPEVAPMFPMDRIAPQRASYPGGKGQPSAGVPEGTPLSNLPAGIPLFVGRTEILDELKESLRKKDGNTEGRIQALSGLGGIGKTQTAIEYARRHGDDYKVLLWAVAESVESLRSNFGSIAALLNLPEANLQDQTSVVNGVKKWLAANEGWLLILDNADDPTLVAEFIPKPFKGSILLTSRAQVFDNLGIFNPLELQSMSPDEAMEFLVRRSGLSNLDDAESKAARELALELDYLPLALEQAGAYIKELQSSFPDYLESYRKRGLELLEKGHPLGKYGKSIRTTWALNFQQIAESSSASADFLRISAFLSPDRIPTELFAEAGDHLGPNISSALAGVQSDPLALDELIKQPVNFSLVHRDRKTKSFNIHRLVQAVLMDAMDGSTHDLWTNRVVNALEHILLDVDNSAISEWVRIERLIPHVQRIADLIAASEALSSAEAVKLFNRAGRYLHLRGRLLESEKLYDEALRNAQHMAGSDDLDLASCLHNKGWLCNDLGQYVKAEPLLLRAVAIRERASDANPQDTARSLLWLGVVYHWQGRFQYARRNLESARAILEENELDNSSDFAEVLHGLAILHAVFGEYTEAEKLLRRSIKILEEKLSTSQHSLAPVLSTLGKNLIAQRQYEEAERILSRAISIFETVFGSDYPRLAVPLTALAEHYAVYSRYDQAEAFLRRALKIRESAFGSCHPEVALSLYHFAELRSRENNYAEAEDFLRKGLLILEETYGPEHPLIADHLMELVSINLAQKKYSKSEPFTRRALDIRRSWLGLENIPTSNALIIRARVLRGLNRKGEAQKLEAQGRKIQSKLLKRSKTNR